MQLYLKNLPEGTKIEQALDMKKLLQTRGIC